MPSIVRIENSKLSAEISSLGAELQSLVTKDGASLLWNGDSEWWTGRSPILFPIVGKAPNDRLTINGETYAMAQHGLARRREFTLVEQTAQSCRHELLADDTTRAVYPFDFRLQLEHSLRDDCLTVTATVTNSGKGAMPYGIGFHPAFLWPLPGAEGRPHRIMLKNGAEPELVRLEGGLLGETRHPSPFKAGELVLDFSQFAEDAMIFPEGAGSALTYSAPGAPKLHFSFENLPNLAIWQKPGAPFICIEPWHGMAAEQGGSDALASRPYTSTLETHQSARYSFSVSIEA
ncbi:aldose 1-epimerase family protein [Rhizobium paknamense]|uniref:Galactose mutarotase-like enzyme n=1 Tax=Rhizobium paknamense TaxID=1206817 RepID=A0ABU0IAX0_9HYPH|nr:aldose 1-epimerase family protein [Rhizobium paknamense]MDQ0454446.1 galactose mutarotase-like enzyme [Rhizobium paknamense]